ncbi:MAG: UvrD-helicase domain-containing protein [Ruminiclostridium sp.]|nr:UvrD-helicase domain-containing protein [Ruminiclostridium sp.]
MPDKIKWTPEQERAITFRDGAAIVSAAAGSGKTAVLVERVKRLILDDKDPVNADEMVISTFTQKAAAEMKARLDKAIDEELAKAPDNTRLIEQRLRLEDASISTISSFCLGLLRRNSAVTELPPDFSVLDESEAKLIFSQSLTAIMEDFCENGDPHERELLYDWYFGEDDRHIEEAVTYLYTFSRNVPDADRYFNEQLALYRDPDGKNGSTALEKYIKAYIIKPAETLSALCGELTELSAGTPAETFAQEWNALSGMLSGIDGAESCAAVYEATLKNAETPALPRKTKSFDNSVHKELNAQMKELWGDILRSAGLVARRKDNMSQCSPVLAALVSLVKKLDAEYSARKREKCRVDFSDIELMTLKLLRGEDGEPSAAAKEIAKGIKIIIVDEFQDSNEIQYEIFRLLSDNKRNLYFVGDIKQSIYRFRGADPLVFARLTKDPEFTVINLNRNFRSCGEVVDAVNGIFTGTMTEELGDVNYDETCALVQGASYEADERHKTELVTFTARLTEDSRKDEAAYIADRIKSMVESGYTVGRGENARPCGYGDFAVLMRSYSSNIALYKAAFTKAGIPFEAKEDGGYTDFAEIKHALALLRVIDDPYRDSDLAAVLMSEPYMFSADEMAGIKLAGGSKRKNLWPGLVEYAKENSRAAAVVNEIRGYREFSEENSAEKLIRKICDESMLIPAAEAAPDGEKRSANLRMLIYYARTFSGGESASLYDFIKYTEQLDRGKIKLPQAKGDSAGSSLVRLMTVHGSKGLEFPVCFVANLSSRPPVSPNGGLLCDPYCGIGMKINDSGKMLTIDTLTYDLAAAESTRLEMSEEMRLLYVAATRAKEKLIFTVPVTAKTQPKMHYGWIIESAAVRDGLIEVRNYSGYKPAQTAVKYDDDAKEPEIKPFTEYHHILASEVPAKVTATQIGVKSVDDFSEQSDHIDRFLRTPSFLIESGSAKLTGKKRGDAYHKVMELLDFGAAAADVPALLDAMRDSGKLSELERASVAEEDIAAFLESPLCRRAAASGDVNREFPIFCEYEPEPGEWGITDWSGEEKPFIQGIADMFFVEDGEIVLVDYKTNRHITAEQLADEYRGQLEIYARALSEATGMRVKEKLLYSFELGEVIV